MAIVDVERVASALNLTRQRVAQLVKEGLPREKRGEYDLIKCLLWYIRYLQAQVSRLSPNVDALGGELDSERKERIGLLRADRELKELKLAREAGQVHRPRRRGESYDRSGGHDQGANPRGA